MVSIDNQMSLLFSKK